MAGRWLDPLWAPGFLCVTLILETASGAGDLSTKAHGHIQFSARGVNQTAMADVSTLAGQEGGSGGGVSVLFPANHHVTLGSTGAQLARLRDKGRDFREQ